MSTSERRLRADAAHNRVLLLDAARAAFVSDGIDVSMAEIARRAGVGFATAQRRFPTKDDLIREIVADEVLQLFGEIETSTSLESRDTLAAAIRACAAHQASSPGLAGAIADQVADDIHSDPTGRITSMFATLTRPAPHEGGPRTDATVEDVLLILKGNAGVIAHSPGSEETASRRFIDVALRGLLH